MFPDSQNFNLAYRLQRQYSVSIFQKSDSSAWHTSFFFIPQEPLVSTLHSCFFFMFFPASLPYSSPYFSLPSSHASYLPFHFQTGVWLKDRFHPLSRTQQPPIGKQSWVEESATMTVPTRSSTPEGSQGPQLRCCPTIASLRNGTKGEEG